MARHRLFADAQVRWFQLLHLPGRFVDAEPKTMRWHIRHTRARVARYARRHIIPILEHWPTSSEILPAYQRIGLLI